MFFFRTAVPILATDVRSFFNFLFCAQSGLARAELSSEKFRVRAFPQEEGEGSVCGL